MAVDVGILDSDLLYLPQDLPSPSGKPGAEKILDDLFTQWLSLPDSQRVVRILSKISLELIFSPTPIVIPLICLSSFLYVVPVHSYGLLSAASLSSFAAY